MNIGLMFVHEGKSDERKIKQRENDEVNSEKIGSNNF